MARVKIEMPLFVETWEACKSAQEVATKLGTKVTSVLARVSKYRSAPWNIPLKSMPRKGGAKLDIGAAKELLAKLRGTTVENINIEATAILAKQVARQAKAAAKAALPVNTNPFSK